MFILSKPNCEWHKTVAHMLTTDMPRLREFPGHSQNFPAIIVNNRWHFIWLIKCVQLTHLDTRVAHDLMKTSTYPYVTLDLCLIDWTVIDLNWYCSFFTILHQSVLWEASISCARMGLRFPIEFLSHVGKAERLHGKKLNSFLHNCWIEIRDSGTRWKLSHVTAINSRSLCEYSHGFFD